MKIIIEIRSRHVMAKKDNFVLKENKLILNSLFLTLNA